MIINIPSSLIFVISLFLPDIVKPRYVRVNTNILSRADALELFAKDGWNEIVGEFTDYDKFLDAVRKLGDSDFVSDMHVRNLFVFPASSKKYWAKLASGDDKSFILQDKVRLNIAQLLSLASVCGFIIHSINSLCLT